jgi:glycosyltransferase involved in cell wall biosynthesis
MDNGMHRRKKILFVVTKSVWGGAQRYVFDIATHLPEELFAIAVAAGGKGPLFDMLKNAGIRILPVRGLARDINMAKEILSFFSLLAIFLREKPDIIHLNSSKTSVLGAVVAFFYKLATLNFSVLTVSTAHGWAFEEKRSAASRAILLLTSAIGALFQNKVILISKADLQSARRFIQKKKLVFIPHGLIPQKRLPKDEARRLIEGIIGHPFDNATILIGTIAELTPNKGIGILINAAAEIAGRKKNLNCRFLIIGDGQEREKLAEVIRRKGLEGIVFLTGFLPDAPRFLSGFDIFVLPSLKEGLPYAVMEAMNAGIPVIATNVGGIPDLIQNNKNGVLVAPENHLPLANAVARLVHNHREREKLSRAGQETIEKYHRFRDMMESTIDVYGEKHDKNRPPN